MAGRRSIFDRLENEDGSKIQPAKITFEKVDTPIAPSKSFSTTPKVELTPIFQTHRDLPSIQTDLTAAKRERSGLLNDFGFDPVDLSQYRVKLDTANQNVNRYKSEKLIEDKVYQSDVKQDTFVGQFSASKTMGRLTQNQSRAWNEYLKNPTPENRKTAQSYDKAIEDYAKKNKIALDDQNVKLGIISQSYANYLPQQVDQLKAQAPGAIVGGAVGMLIGNPIAGAKIGASISSGADMFEITRGAAFKRFLDMGVDEETARALATDEGIVNGLIEGGDTYLDWTLFGGKALATKLLPSLSAKASTAAGKSALAKVIKQIGGKIDNLPTAVKVAGAYGVNIPQEGLEEGSQEVVSLANDQRVKTGETGVLNLMKNSLGLGKDLLTGTDYVVGYDQNGKPIMASEQVKEAAKEGMKIAAVSGGMQAIGGYAAQRALTPKPVKADNKNTPAPVSPAAAPEVQQVQAQAEVTKAQNPEANVLDAATTLFTQQGMNLKTAQTRAEIVGKLVRGEEVSDKDLNKIDPTSNQTKQIFTQLTGVQFPEGKIQIEALRSLYRSAHTVAQAAKAQVATVAENARVESPIPDEQILERAKEARAKTNPESDKKAAQMLAQARGEIAPDGTALPSYKDFAARYMELFPEASRQDAARAYDDFIRDNQTISFMGRRMTRQQVLKTLDTAPGVEQLSAEERAQIEADLNEKFDRELEAQKRDGKDATEHSERRRRTEVREKVQRSVNDWKKVLTENSSVKDIVLDESMAENENAFITSDGVVHLNANRVTSESDIAYVLGHELVHSVKDTDARKAMVNDIIETVRKITEPSESREDAIERYRKMYQEHENQVAARANREAQTISFEYAEEEYAADLMREVFLSGDMLNKLAAEKPSLMARIQEILQKWIASLKGNTEAVELYNDLTALQDRFVQALRTDAAQQKLALENAGVQVDANTESARHDRYSLDTWLESDYMTDPENAAKALAKAIGVSDKKAAKYIKDVNGVAKLIADNKTLLDYEAAPGMSSFVSNTEYGGSVDFSTICKKRRLFTGTFTAIQKALPNTALTSDEMIDIRKRMKDAGHEVSCGLCYVEGSRLNLGQYATEFLDKYTTEDHEFVPAIADLTTVDGQEELRREHPEVYEAYIGYLNTLAQRKPKVYQTATAYNGEILKKFGKDAKVEEKNKNGGLRLQSFSDFEIIHLIDNMQVIMDMARVGLAGQAYTKVPDFAWAMGNTGLKINLSLIAKDVDADGHLVFDDVEGMPHEEAKKLRDAYSDNVGTIIVVFNDAQLKAAMADDFIDYIIPFHRSQLNQKQYDGLGLPKGTKNYTMVQNESYIEPVLNKNGKKTRPDNYMPNTYWDFNKTGKENAEAYLKMCAENNRRPKFSNVLEYNGDGSYSLPADGSADGYWKLLIDFKMYNNDGVGVPQQPVKPDFNIDEANRMLSEYKGGHSNFPVAQDIVDEFVADYKKNHPDVRYSVGYWKPNLDSAEWDIVKSVMSNGRGTNLTAIDKMFFEKTKGKTLFGIYSTDDGTLLYASRDEDAAREHQFVTLAVEEYDNGGLTDTSAEGLSAWAETVRVQSDTDSDHAGDAVASGRLGGDADVYGEQPRLYASEALRNVLENIFKTEESRRSNSVTEQPTQASEESGASSLPKYSITPAFEQWYKETYGEDVSAAHLKRRLKTAERRAAEAEHDKKAAELKNTIDSEMDLTAWMIHHTKKMREQKREFDEKLKEADKARYEAVKSAVAETKMVERAKAEVQHDADRMAERRNAAKRLHTKENVYTQKIQNLKENLKLKRNAARATLKTKALADKKRTEIEAEQGAVNTIRKDPKTRAEMEKRQSAAEELRFAGREFYRTFISGANAIERFAKRQLSDMRADALINIVGGTGSTIDRVFKDGLYDRAGNRIGDAMREVFLCWDAAHKQVDEKMQALLQDFMLHLHNIDRMGFVAKAEHALRDFEEQHPWLRDMDNKELARLIAMTEKEVEKLGKQEAQALAIEYARLTKNRIEAKNKPIFADDNGNAVTASTSQVIVDQYLAENPWLLEKANGIYEWWDLFMREWAVGDTISEAEYNTMRETYPHYVPTYRVDKVGVGGANFVGAGGATVGKAVKKAKGSFSEVMNIEDSFANLVGKIIKLNRVNELYMNIIDTAMLDDGSTFGDLAYFDWEENDLERPDTNEDLTDTVDKTEKTGFEDLGNNEYKLTGWRDGRKFTAFISKDMYQAMEHVTGYAESEREKRIMKTGRILTTPMKMAITGANPFFALRNFARDVSSAYINGISGIKFPIYLKQAFVEMGGNSEHWQQFQALGGTHAGYYHNEKAFSVTMAEQTNVFKKTLSGLQWINENAESATRFAEYLATLDKLGDTYEARLQGIKNAAEVTVDFSRKGDMGKTINAFVPYWNPAVQGIDRLVRSVVDSPDGSKLWKQATVTLGRAALSTVFWEAVQYALLSALDRDDEWEQLSDRVKDTYYCIPLKNEKKFLKIPKNREWGAILGTPFMRMLEYANGRENPFENYIETALVPNFLPPGITDAVVISQLYDLAKNEDFAGRTIVPSTLEKGSRQYQYDADTSYISRGLGMLIKDKISPMQVDYIIEDYLGDWGELATTITSEAFWKGAKSPKDVAEIFTGTMVADARYSNAQTNSYYSMLDELDKVVQDKKNLMGIDKYKETREYQTQKGLEKMYGNDIAELNRQVREMPDGPEKDELKTQIAQLAAQALEFYEDSMAGRIENPIRTAEYADLNGVVSAELIRLDELSGDYGFRPTGDAEKSYTDPKDKQKEYVLTEDQRDYFESLYRETYDEMMLRMIQSTKYKNTKDDKKKAEMLAELRKEVLKATKEEFFDWLEDNRVRSTPKK